MALKTKKRVKNSRVVVTGLGAVTSVGQSTSQFWQSLISGQSGISPIRSFDTSNSPVHQGGEIHGFSPQPFLLKRLFKKMGRASQLAAYASYLALRDAGLISQSLKASKNNLGVIIGTTMGETQILESLNRSWLKIGEQAISKNLLATYSSNSLSVNVGMAFRAFGFNGVFPTACSSANYALGYGYDLIKTGELDTIVCGGSDAFSKIAFVGFNRLFAMAPDKCQPFDKNRRGMVLGEGAGVLVLENLEQVLRRKGKYYAEVLSYGLSCDACHMTQPLASGVAASIKKALLAAEIENDRVSYISAHGTGTPQNDKVECTALRQIFGERLMSIPCSSIKSMLGHTMGAASALESIVCCLAIRDQILPPTINFETPDSECEIDCVPNSYRRARVEITLNNSCAFGGNNACIIFSHPNRL